MAALTTKIEIRNVQLKQIENGQTNELAKVFYRNCSFCEKIVKVAPNNIQSCVNIGGKYFYCPFCLRHNHHHRSAQNILIMSYRGLIGYYYHRFYRGEGNHDNRTMYWADIQRMIDKHRIVGMSNPVFNYDPATYLWFIDFNRIGNQKRKAPYAEVLETAKVMLHVFEVLNCAGRYGEDDFWDKIQKAMTLFYEQRKRPKDRKMLIPTLAGSLPNVTDEFVEDCRNFVAGQMEIT